MRRITSIILTVVFIVVSVTGVQIDIVQEILKDSLTAEGNSLTIQKEIAGTGVAIIVSQNELFYPKSIHKIAGYAFILVGLMHLGLNIRPLLAYLKLKH
jgi:hypothetical protein